MKREKGSNKRIIIIVSLVISALLASCSVEIDTGLPTKSDSSRDLADTSPNITPTASTPVSLPVKTDDPLDMDDSIEYLPLESGKENFKTSGSISTDPTTVPLAAAENAEMYAAYSCVLADSHNFTHPLIDFDGFVPVVEGGGLLDFDFDGIDDLVLIYRHVEFMSIQICVVYSYKDGQIVELFSQLLSSGGNWGYFSILQKDGKGAIREYNYLHPEGEGPHVMGGDAYFYSVFENGELACKLGYYQNNFLSDFHQKTADYQVWKIYRDGVEITSGIAPPDELIPEIEALKVEAEALYGGEWKPLSVNALMELLRGVTLE